MKSIVRTLAARARTVRNVGAAGAGLALVAGCAALETGGQPAAEALRAPAPFTETIPGTAVSFDMVGVPAGAVTLEDLENPGELLTIDVGPLWIGKTEVTWDMYDAFVYRLDVPDPERAAGVDAVSRPTKPYLPPDRGFGHAGYPAMSLSHHGATEFCAWLSAKTGRRYRLPTEAEWIYACRAGGDGTHADPDAVAWHARNAGDKTQPVGKKAPNAWGIHDMLGNVQEWVDGMDGKPVTMGGSYRDPPESVSCEAGEAQDRSWNASDPQIPKSRWWLADGPFVGFRVVCEPED